MNRHGFTLVELLAVIVILAIILAIAIPSISNMIENSRLNSFQISSKMLEKAVKTYISASNITISSGSTIEILYSDIKNAGYISKIVDPISDNECTLSRIYVKNVTNNYIYEKAVICDNYMDIGAYNLITNGNFSDGSTVWNYTAGASLDSGAGRDGGAVGKVVYNGSTPAIVQQDFSMVNGHKYYGYGWFKRTGSVGTGGSNQFDISNLSPENDFVNLSNTTLPLENVWYKLSNISVAQVSGLGKARFFNISPSSTIYGDDLIIFDLTAIYGSGNEPTIAAMDNIIFNMSK